MHLAFSQMPPQKIADGVWFLIGDSSKGYSNTTIIEMQDYLIVVDANYPGRAKELIDIGEGTVEQARPLCLRHPRPRRPLLRQFDLDRRWSNHDGLSRRSQ